MFEQSNTNVMTSAVSGDKLLAARLNQECLCSSVDHRRLLQSLATGGNGELDAVVAGLRRTHPHLFSDTRVYVAESDLCRMAKLVAAIERIVALPGWQVRALAQAPANARHQPTAVGVFLGFDFHLGEHGPQLIEINTNAGGGLLNARLLHAQLAVCDHALGRLAGRTVESDFLAMFREEWRLAGSDRPLRRIAIVDEAPATQFLLPEFLLFQRLFEEAGIAAVIADPRELSLGNGRLRCRGDDIDLVYNRLTDFSLEEPQNAVLREAWLSDAVVLTPHPYAHAVYADKRNLVMLGDMPWLREIGVSTEDMAIVQAGVPRTERVTAENADAFWSERRQWFFKPDAGYGGKAAYRGDKLTRRVFSTIAEGGYIAQALVPPSERQVCVDGVTRTLKLDVRNFVYRGQVQLVSARLYQGQTTNFRTHGGGFAAVLSV